MQTGKTLDQFEKEHGQERVHELKQTINKLAKQRKKVEIILPSGETTFRFGIAGDTHNGSLYEAKDELDAFYEVIRKEGIKEVMHPGDVLDGHRLYKGQEFELHRHGWAEQRDWFAKVAPKVQGVTVRFITGNHDASLKKIAGIDVGPGLQTMRPDYDFLSEDMGVIVCTTGSGRQITVMMLHPAGGSSYALSYRPQKIVEQIEGGKKPDVLLIGNYHKAEWMPNYRNVSVFQSGCFQRQTPFMMTKGLAAHVGGWIVEVTPSNKAATVKARFIAFF